MIAHILDTLVPRRGRRAVVLCDGPRPRPETLAACLGDRDLFIVTDGAGRPFDDLPRPPDVVIGDFDTLGNTPPDTATTRYIHDVGQNTTDSEKALTLVAHESCSEAIVLGALGGLFDHSLSNAALPERFSWLLRVALVSDQDVTVRVGAKDDQEWSLPERSIVSLTPSGTGARGVTISGVRWPLENEDLAWAGPSTISNHVIDPPVHLAIQSGSLLATVRTEPAP